MDEEELLPSVTSAVTHGLSHWLPGLIHALDVLLGPQPQCCNAGAPLVHVLHRVFVSEGGGTLVGGRSHRLHSLRHGGGRV